MSINALPGVNGSILRVTYVDEFIPYLMVSQHTGEVTGHLVEIWRILAQRMNLQLELTKDEYSLSSNPYEYTGVLARVRDGQALTSIDASGMTPDRFFMFKRSTTVYFSRRGFYEVRPVAAQEDTRIEFFTVFSLPIISLLISCLFIAWFIEFLVRTVKVPPKSNRTWRNLTHRFAKVFYSVAIALVAYFHGAGFKGNNSVMVLPKATTFAEIVPQIWSGQRVLLSRSNEFLAEEAAFLFRNRSAEISPTGELEHILLNVCARREGVVRLYDNELLGLGLLKRDHKGCDISSIEVTPIEGKEIPYEMTYKQNIPYFYLYNKMMPSRFIERVDQMVLRIFDYDRMDTFWSRRFMSRGNLPTDSVLSLIPSSEFTYDPMSLSRLRIIFLIFMSLQACCVCVAIYECFHRRFIYLVSKYVYERENNEIKIRNRH